MTLLVLVLVYNLGVLGHFAPPPWVFLALILAQKNQTRKIVKIHKEFEL